MFQNVLLLVGSLVAFVLLLELGLQLVVPLVFRPRITKVDPEVGWYHNASVGSDDRLEDHSYRATYNSHGYRSPEHAYEKPAGSRRIVVLGDSFVDGSEVGDQELFTWHLQQSLPNVEVINLGVYSYSTAQELITLQREGFRYDPDLVVLVTFPNDFVENSLNLSYFGPAPRFRLAGDSIELEPTTGVAAEEAFESSNLPVPGMAFLHRHSLVYHVLNHNIYQPLIAKKITATMDAQKGAIGPAERRELYRRIVLRMKQLCDQRGVDLVVVFVHGRAELTRAPVSQFEAVQQTLEAAGVATLDAFNALRNRELSTDGSLYYKTDIHWNAVGHRFVADFLVPELRQRLEARQESVGAPPPRM